MKKKDKKTKSKRFKIISFLMVLTLGITYFFASNQIGSMQPGPIFKYRTARSIKKDLERHGLEGNIENTKYEITEFPDLFGPMRYLNISTTYYEIIDGEKISIDLGFSPKVDVASSKHPLDYDGYNLQRLHEAAWQNPEGKKIINNVKKVFDTNILTQMGYSMLVLDDYDYHDYGQVDDDSSTIKKIAKQNSKSSDPKINSFDGWYHLPIVENMKSQDLYISMLFAVDQKNNNRDLDTFENDFINWANQLNYSTLPDGKYDVGVFSSNDIGLSLIVENGKLASLKTSRE